jgi:hypothetical protein
MTIERVDDGVELDLQTRIAAPGIRVVAGML